MYGLDLFSGIGGITKALEGYITPVAYCENDKFCQAIILSRIFEGELPNAPIWDNVRSLSSVEVPPVDIIYGGFPCQDISVAGRGAGLGGERSGLFFEIVRLAQEIKPTFIFLENVPNIRTKGLSRVVRELAEIGYDCRWDTLSAADVGAPIKRERFFLLACSTGTRRRNDVPTQGINNSEDSSNFWKDAETYISACSNENEYAGNPEHLRVCNGVPAYVDRLRAMGNAVVPAQAREAFERLMGLK